MAFSKYIFTFLLIFTLFSCKKTEKPVIKSIKTEFGVLPIMVPFQNDLPEISKSFVASKKYEIQKFYEQNWVGNSLNGGFLVAKNGQIIYEKYNGFADLSTKSPMTAETPLHIASVSKVVTATAILKLVDVKKISLDQKLNTILPTFPFDSITIRTLLNHRSGLNNYAYFTNKIEIWDPKFVMRNQDVLNILATKKIPLNFPTDTKFSYSNTNYTLLALVIEKITGLKYPEAIKKMIFEPLGMTNSYVFEYKKNLHSATPSYKWNGQKYPIDYLDGIYGDKNVFSTPRDLLKLDMARRSKNFVNPELEKEIYKGYSHEHRGTKNYGLGIRMLEWETGEPYYFHNGWWHGNTSSYISLGKEHVTIISLSNKFNHATYKVRNLASLFGDYPFKVADTVQ